MLILKRTRAKAIIEAAATMCELTPYELRAKDKHEDRVLARGLAAWSIRTHLGYSWPQIGRLLGGKHHTTMIHVHDKIERLRATDQDVQAALDIIAEAR